MVTGEFVKDQPTKMQGSFQKRVSFLGPIISEAGVTFDPEKH